MKVCVIIVENVPSVCSPIQYGLSTWNQCDILNNIPTRGHFPVLREDSLASRFWSPPRTVSTLLSWWMNPETLLWAINWVKPQGGSKALKSHYQRQRLTSKNSFCNTGTLHHSLFQPPFLATFSEICIQVVPDIVLSCIPIFSQSFSWGVLPSLLLIKTLPANPNITYLRSCP